MDSASQASHREVKKGRRRLACWKEALLSGLGLVSDSLWRDLKARSRSTGSGRGGVGVYIAAAAGL